MSDIEMTRGDTQVYDIAVVDPVTGNPINLTGMTLAFMAKRSRSDSDASAVISKTLGSGIAITNVAAGLGTLTIDPADTASVVETMQLEWDLQLVNAGQVFTLDSGYLLIRADVKRSGT